MARLAEGGGAANGAWRGIVELEQRGGRGVRQGARQGGAQGIGVTPSPFAASQQDRLVRFAAEHRLPAMYFSEDFVDAGGLMSYGPSIVEAYRRAAAYVDRILKGAKPGDLPVEQPTRFDLVVNATTAKQLDLVLPQPILLRANRLVG